VWAVDAEQAPAYWVPRDCPRVLAWTGPETTAADQRLLCDRRVHAIEYGWLPRAGEGADELSAIGRSGRSSL
jgi:hypothetical protein